MRAMARSFRQLLLLILVLSVVAVGAFAQGTTSRVVGVVTDESGAVVPGAKVTLTNEGTGVPFTTTTTSAGTYVFEAVQVGKYTVTVEREGFKTFVSKGNALTIGQPLTVNATLTVGAVTESVQVTESAELVQTSTSGNWGNLVDQKSIQDLPLIGGRGRNILDFVFYQPGVVRGANTGGDIHVHGARDRSWNFTLDGIDTNDTSAGGSNFSPLRTNPDSVAEFRVVTSNATAEFGRNSGGQVTMVTRSGTNSFHGSAFWFYRTPSLFATEFENTVGLNNIAKGQFVLHMFGGSVGGPVRKDRTFFFFNTQLLRASKTNPVTRTVYTSLARQGIFRYVAGGRNAPAGAASPLVPSVDANGNPVFPDCSPPTLVTNCIATYNIISSDPRGLGASLPMGQLIGMTQPPNNFFAGDGLNTAGFSFNAPEKERQRDFVIKIDHVFNPRQTVYVRYAWGRQNTFGDSANTGQPRFPGGVNVVDTFRTPRNLAINWRWSPRSNITNEFVIGGNHFMFNFANPDPNLGNIPPFIMNNVTDPLNTFRGNIRSFNTYQMVDNLSWVRGAHALKFGINFRYQQHIDIRGSIAGANAMAEVDLDTTTNSVNTACLSGAPGMDANGVEFFCLPGGTGSTAPVINTTFDRPRLARAINDLLGRVGRMSQAFVSAFTGDQFAPGGTDFNFDARYPEYDFYAQDSWKLTPKLTLDLGLRWELKMTPRTTQERIFRPDVPVRVGEPATNTLRWEREPLYDNDINNFGPSIGLAWDPVGDGKTSLRANYRLAYDRINTFVISSRIYQSLPGQTLAVTNTAFGQGAGRIGVCPISQPNCTLGAFGVPTLSPSTLPSQSLQPAALSVNSIHVVDPSFRAPKTNMWGLSVQRELWRKILFEANYIGRRGVGLFGAYNANQVNILAADPQTSETFLTAFNTARCAVLQNSGTGCPNNGISPLMERLTAADSRRLTTENSWQFLRRLFLSPMDLGSVAGLANSFTSRIEASDGRSVPDRAGLGPFFFIPYPQFTGAMNVIESNDFSTYHALEIQVQRRFAQGLGFQVAYTFAKSLDTRSFDPTFTVVSTGTSQSASSSPFDIFNRRLNYARSDFDRTHAFQVNWVWELPFGRGRRWGAGLHAVLDRVVGGWETAGFMNWYSGRPFTVYAGTDANTFTNVVVSPARCSGCDRSTGSINRENGTVFYFNPFERASFLKPNGATGSPAPGQLGNAGRNFFTGPQRFNIDMSLIKRTRITESQNIEFRAEFENLTNTPSFGFPTAVVTSTTFGRIRDSVVSSSRKIQLALKYNF